MVVERVSITGLLMMMVNLVVMHVVVVLSTWRQVAGRFPREGREDATKPAHAVSAAVLR